MILDPIRTFEDMSAPRSGPLPHAQHRLDDGCAFDDMPAREPADRTKRASDELLSRGCAVCEQLEASSKEYFGHAFTDRQRLPAICESLVDAGGFCKRHARMLASREELAEEVARAFVSVIAKYEEILGHEKFYADRLQEISFAANHSCPACWFEHYRSAVLLDRLMWSAASAFRCTRVLPVIMLCFPHFQQLTPALKLDMLGQWVELQIKTISCFEPALADARRDPLIATVEHSALDLETLRAALRMLRGKPPTRSPVLVNQHGVWDDPDSNRGDPYCALGHPKKCPVCVEMHRAFTRAMDRLPQALAFGHEFWLAFPDCAEHVWACMQEHDSLIAAAVVRQVFDNTMSHLKKVRSALRQLAQWEQEVASALQEGKERPRRMRPPSPNQVLSHAPRCPVCERVAIAHDAALERVLAAAQSRKGRDALQLGYGLCGKHFADAYALTLRNEIQSHLASMHLERLGRLKSQLERELVSSLAPTIESRSHAEAPAWREALRRFSGE